MEWVKWIFDGIGSQIVGLIVGALLGGLIGYRIGIKNKIKQKQKGRDNKPFFHNSPPGKSFSFNSAGKKKSINMKPHIP